MVKKPQSEMSKAIDKANKLAVKGKYDEAVRVLLPYQSDSGVQKIIEATRNLGKSVKELQSDSIHKLVVKKKRGWWPF